MDNLAYSSNNGQANSEYSPTKKQRKSHQRQSHHNRHNSSHQCGVCLNYDSRCKDSHKGIICWNSGERNSLSIGQVFNGYRYNKESNGYGGLFTLYDENYKSDRTNNPTPSVKELSGLNKLSLPKLSSELDKLHGQLPLTRRHLAVIRDKAPCDIPTTLANKAFSSAKGYTSLDSSISSKVAGIVDRTSKGTGRFLNLSMGDYNKDTSVVLCWAFNVHGQRIGYQRWDINLVNGGEGKYTYTTYYKSRSQVNSAPIKLDNKTEELPMPVWISENNLQPDTLFLCEGFRKSFNAHLHLKANVIGYTQGMEGYKVQISDAIATLKPKRIVFMSDTNTMANSTVFSRLNSSVKYLSELSDEYEVFVSDWGQLWSGKENTLDIDEVDLDRVHSQTLIPARFWGGFEGENDEENDAIFCFLYIYNRENSNSPQKAHHFTIQMALKANNTNAFLSVRLLGYRCLEEIHKLTNNQLIHRFLSKDKLSVAECAAIASSLTHVEGGAKFYLDHLHPDYLKKRGAYQNVQKFCKMLRSCQPVELPDSNYSLYDLLNPFSVLRLKQPVIVSSDIAYEILKNNFNKVLKADMDGSVYSINADTGLGKTRLVSEGLKSGRLNNCVIAFKTHALKDAFAAQLDKGTYKKQIELKLPEKLTNIFNKLYACGLNSVVYQILTELANFGTSRYPSKHDSTILKMDTHAKAYGVKPTYIQFDGLVEATNDVDKGVREHIREYLAVNKELCSSECELPKLVTHDFLLYRAKAFRGIPIIIDEDFTNSLYLSIDLNIGDITNIAHSSDRIDFWGKKLMGELEAMKEFSTLDITHINPDFSDIEKSISTYSLSLDVAVLYGATRVLKLEKGQFTFYVDKDVLPLTNNYIQLSATPRNDILKQKYGDRVKILETPTVSLKGNLRQVVDIKTSKTQLRKLEDFDYLQKLVAGDTVITHKEFKKHFKKADKICHHGNVEGYNHLTGQNISFVGELKLPHQALIKQFVGAGFSLKDRSLRLIKNQRVTFNNYRFGLHSFADKDLLQFQLEAINAQQEQAVGRARLVRTDAIATVIAHFPLLQSKIISSQELLEQRDIEKRDIETLAIASVKIEAVEAIEPDLDKIQTIIKEEVERQNEQTTERNSTIPAIQSCIENSDQARCSDYERQSVQTELEAFVQKKLEGNNFDLQTTKLFILFYQDTGNSQPIEEMLENEMFLASSVRQFRNTPDSELEKLTIGKAIAK